MPEPTSVQTTAIWDEQDEAHADDLRGIVLDALRIKPPLYLISLLGKPHTWLRRRRYAEYTVLSPWHPWRSVRTIVNVSVPSLPMTPPAVGPPLINRVFWQPSVILQRPDHNGNATTFPNEQWFFLNGVMTNDVVAQFNAAYLAYLFHRPITLIQNATDSLFVDLLECAFGKQWQRTTEPVIKALPVIYDALKSPHKKRVVVIAHSQGTIIMANVLRLLALIPSPSEWEKKSADRVAPAAMSGDVESVVVYPDQTPLYPDDFEPLTADEWGKLEVYCFATCANQLSYFRQPTEDESPLPWIEHFGNQQDIVARLGMLAPRPKQWGIHIDGPIYVRAGAWGHLLTEHYLFAIADAQKCRRKRGALGGSAPFSLLNEDTLKPSAYKETPRLFRYLNGGV